MHVSTTSNVAKSKTLQKSCSSLISRWYSIEESLTGHYCWKQLRLILQTGFIRVDSRLAPFAPAVTLKGLVQGAPNGVELSSGISLSDVEFVIAAQRESTLLPDRTGYGA
jgi:hypothetical protein